MKALSNRRVADDREESYAQRLVRLQRAPWKRLLPIQLPYALHLRAVARGATLEIGCGIGRNLRVLKGGAIGVDRDRESVDYVNNILQLRAYTPEEFQRCQHARSMFDTLLFSHVLEHIPLDQVDSLVSSYLPCLRSAGRVIVITPQERGYASDPTHVAFFDFDSAARLARSTGLLVERQYSFPFPRFAGGMFRYNEFVSLLSAR
jgi:SAM-dependent methyltransferase